MVHAPLVLMPLAVMLVPIPLVPRTYVDIDCADGTGATGTDAGPAAVESLMALRVWPCGRQALHGAAPFDITLARRQ